jgi:hypothetical protein
MEQDMEPLFTHPTRGLAAAGACIAALALSAPASALAVSGYAEGDNAARAAYPIAPQAADGGITTLSDNTTAPESGRGGGTPLPAETVVPSSSDPSGDPASSTPGSSRGGAAPTAAEGAKAAGDDRHQGGLAFTGADAGLLGGVGVLLLVGGAMLRRHITAS